MKALNNFILKRVAIFTAICCCCAFSLLAFGCDQYKNPVSIEILSAKTDYFVGEEFSFDGFITVSYSTRATKNISFLDKNVSIEGFDSSAEGEKEITVEYFGLFASYSITVAFDPQNPLTPLLMLIDSLPTFTLDSNPQITSQQKSAANEAFELLDALSAPQLERLTDQQIQRVCGAFFGIKYFEARAALANASDSFSQACTQGRLVGDHLSLSSQIDSAATSYEALVSAIDSGGIWNAYRDVLCVDSTSASQLFALLNGAYQQLKSHKNILALTRNIAEVLVYADNLGSTESNMLFMAVYLGKIAAINLQIDNLSTSEYQIYIQVNAHENSALSLTLANICDRLATDFDNMIELLAPNYHLFDENAKKVFADFLAIFLRKMLNDDGFYRAGNTDFDNDIVALRDSLHLLNAYDKADILYFQSGYYYDLLFEHAAYYLTSDVLEAYKLLAVEVVWQYIIYLVEDYTLPFLFSMNDFCLALNSLDQAQAQSLIDYSDEFEFYKSAFEDFGFFVDEGISGEIIDFINLYEQTFEALSAISFVGDWTYFLLIMPKLNAFVEEGGQKLSDFIDINRPTAESDSTYADYIAEFNMIYQSFFDSFIEFSTTDKDIFDSFFSLAADWTSAGGYLDNGLFDPSLLPDFYTRFDALARLIFNQDFLERYTFLYCFELTFQMMAIDYFSAVLSAEQMAVFSDIYLASLYYIQGDVDGFSLIMLAAQTAYHALTDTQAFDAYAGYIYNLLVNLLAS